MERILPLGPQIWSLSFFKRSFRSKDTLWKNAGEKEKQTLLHMEIEKFYGLTPNSPSYSQQAEGDRVAFSGVEHDNRRGRREAERWYAARAILGIDINGLIAELYSRVLWMLVILVLVPGINYSRWECRCREGGVARCESLWRTYQ